MAISTQINSPVEYRKLTFVLTSSNIKSMYGTPVLVLPAMGLHTIIVIHDAFFEFVYTAPDYTDGEFGSFVLQYGNTIHGGSSNIAALPPAVLTNSQSVVGASAQINLNLTGPISNLVNTGIYASNSVAAYATGNGLMNMTLFYSIINTIA